MSAAATDLRPRLMSFALVLTALIVLYWLLLAQPRPLPVPIVPDAAALTPRAIARPALEANITEAIVSRPLFLVARRPIPSSPDPTPEETANQVTDAFNDARLVGVARAADGARVAIVVRAAGTVRLKEGDLLDGWKLEALEERRARFSHGNEPARELQLLYTHQQPARK
ncbi:MAG: hypothetical protein LBB76_10590 [Azoarcus sp.]|jgi:hypothetical protein|nr:hypothetical protein [Azoarcus sp.]